MSVKKKKKLNEINLCFVQVNHTKLLEHVRMQLQLNKMQEWPNQLRP